MSLGMAGASAFMSAEMMQEHNPFRGTADVTKRNAGKSAYSLGGKGRGKGGIRARKRTSGWDWRQRNPGTGGMGETQYSKRGFGNDWRYG